MKNVRYFAFMLLVFVVAGGLVGCSRDPNVRKQKYLESGKRFMAAKKYREAGIQFANALQVDKNFADAHYQLAQAYLKLGSFSNAYVELLRTVELEPKNEKARIDLGKFLIGDRQIDKAKDLADSIISDNPQSADGRALLASASFAEGKFTTAIDQMHDAIALSPNNSEYFSLLGAIQIQAKNYQDAEASLIKAIELNPKSASPVIALAAFYQSQGRKGEAEEQYKKAVGVEPTELQPRVALVEFYLGQSRRAEAEQTARQAQKDLGDTENAYRLLADVYITLGDLDSALSEFARLVKEHPKDLALKKNYAELLIRTGHAPEAEKIVSEILEKNPKDTDALVFRAQFLMQQNKISDAIANLETAIKNDSDNAIAHYQLAVATLAAGDSGRSEKELREAVRLRPSFYEAQQMLAGVAMSKGDQNTALSSAEMMMKIRPSSPDPLIMRANIELSRRQFDLAEGDLKKATEVAPQNPRGQVALGLFRLAQKRTAEANNLFEAALTQDPGDVAALEGLVQVYGVTKMPPAKAISRVQEQISKQPKNSSLYTLAGRLAARNNDLPGAQKLFEKAIELNSNDLDAFMLLGQVAKLQSSTDAAIAAWQQWSQKNPNDVRPYMLLGSMEAQRDWQKAQQYYQKALSIQPDFAPAANNLAYSMLEHGGNVDVALSLAQTARRGLPNSPYAADTLAWTYYRKGLYASAVTLLEEATKQVPNNSTFQFHLGMTYQKQGDSTKAKMHLAQAIQLDPKSPQSNEARQVLDSTGK